jgi:threonine dehydrogenase-like Zn-dependent dehydrogenase
VSDRGKTTALALMAAELRGDDEGVAVIVAGCGHLGEAVVALVAFAAEAARMAGHRTVPDELLAEVASKHLVRLAKDDR